MDDGRSFPQGDPEELEEARLAALAAQALEASPEPVFDAIANAAALMTGCPIALVSFMKRDRQWFKAKCGISIDGTKREVSFCRYAVDGRTVIESLDMTSDPRFKDNPFVSGNEAMRYYLGVPIKARNGAVLGTICVIDRKPRKASDKEVVEALRGLAVAIEQIITSRSIIRQQQARFEVIAELESRLDKDSDPELEAVSQIGLSSAAPEPREWTKRLFEDFATDSPASPNDGSETKSHWQGVVSAAVRGVRPAANKANIAIATDFGETASIRPPVIFARVVFSMLQQAIRRASSDMPVEVGVNRKAGFVLFSVAYSGHAQIDETDVARWMRTTGGIFNVKNHDGRASLLAWFPIG